MPNITNEIKYQVLARMWKNWNAYAFYIGGNVKMVHPLWKRIWTCPQKLKIEPHTIPIIPHLGIYPKKLQVGS